MTRTMRPATAGSDLNMLITWKHTQLRPMCAHHAEQLAVEMAERSVRHVQAGSIDRALAAQRWLARQTEHQHGGVWLRAMEIWDDGQLVGWQEIAGTETPSTVRLVAGFVADEHRGRGIGSTVLGMLAEYAFTALAADKVTGRYGPWDVAAAVAFDQVGLSTTTREIRELAGQRTEIQHVGADAARWRTVRNPALDTLAVTPQLPRDSRRAAGR